MRIYADPVRHCALKAACPEVTESSNQGLPVGNGTEPATHPSLIGGVCDFKAGLPAPASPYPSKPEPI